MAVRRPAWRLRLRHWWHGNAPEVKRLAFELTGTALLLGGLGCLFFLFLALGA